MNETKNLKIILVCFALFSVIGAYYIGYMSAKLGLSAPFLPNIAGTTANKPADTNQPEPKLVETVAPLTLVGDEVTFGNKNSSIELVVFTDFECPFCARFHPGLMAVQKANDSKLVFKHFPLSFHDHAKNLALTFECVAKNSSADNAVAFADSIFEENMKLQGKITFDIGRKLANKFINNQTIDSCLNDKTLIDKIDNSFTEGSSLGIQGTPALYIQNTKTGKATRINGALDQQTIQAEFDKIK